MNFRNFGEFLHQKRAEAEITQNQLAAAIGKSGMYISNIEKGKNPSPPNRVDLDSLANALKLDFSEKLLFYELAAADRGTLPQEIINYINKCCSLKSLIHVGMNQQYSEEFWQKLLRQFSGGNNNG